MTLAVHAAHLRKVYKSGLRRQSFTAVKDVDLRVAQGEVYGFLGLNGAGKTTSVMMLLDCIRPTAGSATLFGTPTTDHAARRRVGFLPERFRFHDFLTPNELLRVHGGLAGLSESACRKRIGETLELVGLAARADTPVRQFSKGMQQRIGLAQAILPDPDLLILDEPTSGLDPLGRREVRDIILRLKDQGKTVLLNSHLLSEIELCCDRVAILHKGTIVREGPIKDLVDPQARVDIECHELTNNTLEAVLALDATTAAHRTPNGLSVELEDLASVPDVVAELVANGARVSAVRPHPESLEEFFVRTVEEPQP